MRVNMTCKRGSCDLGEVLEFERKLNGLIYVKTRITDLDVVRKLAEGQQLPYDRWMGGGGLIFSFEEIHGYLQGRNCRLEAE